MTLFHGCPVDELHRVEEALLILAEMVDGGDVAVAQAGSGARLADEAFAGGGVVEELRVDDLQRDGRAQVGVLGLVGHAHRPAPEFPQAAVIRLSQDAVVMEVFRRFVLRHGGLRGAGAAKLITRQRQERQARSCQRQRRAENGCLARPREEQNPQS